MNDNNIAEPLSRRKFIELSALVGASAIIGGSLIGCTGSSAGASGTSAASASFDPSDWNALLEEAKGQTVTFYGYGGEEDRNKWLDTTVADALKSKYDITLERVPMDINDVLTKLSGEIQAGTQAGSIDFIWINGENFYSCKKNGYLYGPFTQYLPNYSAYIDTSAAENQYDFGEPIENYEAPYGKAQMQMWVDTAKVADMPADPDAFLEFCKMYPGKVTYPTPGDFTGTAFIECLIAGVVGKDAFEQLAQMEADKEKVRAIIEPGLTYLKSLNPYLWQAGKTFPADHSTLSQMFADGELIMDMGYGSPDSDIEDGIIPNTVRSFLFDTGTVGNENFMAIAKNASHKAAAMVAINEIMSPELQLSIYDTLGVISVLDTDKLSAAQKQSFAAVKTGVAALPADELLAHRIAEASGAVVPLIEALWTEEVVGK